MFLQFDPTWPSMIRSLQVKLGDPLGTGLFISLCQVIKYDVYAVRYNTINRENYVTIYNCPDVLIEWKLKYFDVPFVLPGAASPIEHPIVEAYALAN